MKPGYAPQILYEPVRASATAQCYASARVVVRLQVPGPEWVAPGWPHVDSSDGEKQDDCQIDSAQSHHCQIRD